MKSAEQTDASPYVSALARVRSLRAEPHSVPVKPTDFVQRLKRRILQARIRLRLPVRAGELASYEITPQVADRVGWVLWGIVPLLLLSVFALLITNPATSPPASVPALLNLGIQTFNYPLSPLSQKTLSEGNALAITVQTLSRAGYDLREWEGAEFDSIKGISTIAKDRFYRVSDLSGYYIFEQPVELVIGPNNQPVEEKFRRLTVTLKQNDETLKVILSDSVRSRLRAR